MSPYSVGFAVKAVLLVIAGLYFFLRYPRRGAPLWISLIMITSGVFDLRFGLEYWAQRHDATAFMQAVSQGGVGLLAVGANTVYYCLVLNFYLDAVGYSRPARRALLFVPIPVTLLFFTQWSPVFQINYAFTAIWGSVYMLASLVLFLIHLSRQRSRDAFLVQIAFALILLVNGFLLLYAQIIGQDFARMINIAAHSAYLIFCFILLLWVNMKKMLVGMQHKAVARKMDMGTALLHHAFKNAIGKVKINAWNIRASLSNKRYEEIDAYVNNLLSTYEHMMSMMAKVSQIVQDKLAISPKPVELSALLNQAAETARSMPEVNVVTRYEPIGAVLDTDLMLECLLNIVHNAVDAMQGAGTLTITAEALDGWIFISVEDTGIGMDDDQLSQLFEPFWSTKGRTGKNMGLGMYYVRKVMDAHKGKVTVDSEPGRGTTVTLAIRQRKVLGRYAADQSHAG